jgi:hypothetical protein
LFYYDWNYCYFMLFLPCGLSFYVLC